MSDVLDQSEVDALLAAVDTGSVAMEATPPAAATALFGARGASKVDVQVYDFKRPERVSKDQMRALAQICHTLRANVNLLRYNEVPGTPFQRPKADDVVVFQDVLRHNGVNAHVRKSRGRDIDAACGQLRKKEQEQGQLVTLGGAVASAS